MKILKGLIFFFFISLAGTMNAQDIHFTQFYLSPLTTNPAYTGAFEGSFRIGGIYRDQWGSVISSPYRTPSFYIDAPILMLGKKAWLGVGGMLYSDKAGALELSTSQAMGSLAVHMPLDKKSKSVFTFGVQAGYTSRKLNTSQGIFADNPGGIGTSADLGNISGDTDFNSNEFDLNVGVLLKAQMNDKMRLEIGASFNHILTPDLHVNEGGGTDTTTTPNSLYTASAEGRDAWDLPGDFTLHGQFFVDLNDKWQIKPAFMYRTLSGANNIQVQGIGGYHLNDAKDMESDAVEFKAQFAGNFGIRLDSEVSDDSDDEEDLQKIWSEYQKSQIKKGEKSMASILAASLPKLAENFNIEFVLPNKLMEDQLKLGKPKLLKFLRESLNNYSITINVTVNETVEKKFAYTPQEKYNKLKEKNPHIEKLKDTFQLDL